MTSFILRVTIRYILPLLLLFSVFLFLRGHNEPGGGFAAGLIAAASFSLYTIAFGSASARHVLSVDPRNLIGIGLLLSFLSGLIPVFSGLPFLSGEWIKIPMPGIAPIEIGTPFLFDLGVFLVVAGVTLTFVFVFEEEI
jgi:multicomponent Na+:H+ antiporter subunit B